MVVKVTAIDTTDFGRFKHLSGRCSMLSMLVFLEDEIGKYGRFFYEHDF